MKFFRTIPNRAFPKSGCALTIGNFDAVHLGHQAILNRLRDEGRARNLPTGVLTFDPHPREYFATLKNHPSALPQAHARLTTTTSRYFALAQSKLAFMLSLKFGADLAATSAEEFVRDYLVQRLKVKYLLVGDDFRFGAKRGGDFGLLAQMAPQHGYEVAQVATVAQREQRISSTRIRHLLASGDLAQAARLLGRPYAYVGRVIHGEKRGREWGYPTINLRIPPHLGLRGIFAVRVRGLESQPLNGVASLGVRPNITTDSPNRALLEVHIFDYAGDAYGERVCVEFIAKIRDEAKFADTQTLVAAIGEDATRAKQILGITSHAQTQTH